MSRFCWDFVIVVRSFPQPRRGCYHVEIMGATTPRINDVLRAEYNNILMIIWQKADHLDLLVYDKAREEKTMPVWMGTAPTLQTAVDTIEAAAFGYRAPNSGQSLEWHFYNSDTLDI
jgi:hypothetical protein